MRLPLGDRLRILVIAPSRHPIREPHAGGLEALVWDRVRSLRASGHDVTLVAARGSDFLDRTPERMRLPRVVWGGGRSSDEAYPDGYLDQVASVLDAVVDELVVDRTAFDLIDNHSLHPVPIARAAEHGIPMLTTLHTPPLPELVAAADAAGPAHSFLAVSAHTAGEWRASGVESTVLLNTVDADAWPLGPGGPGLVWFGRIVPEKGPHLAADAARAMGRPLVVAGRVGDEQYFERSVVPRLGGGIRHVGPMRRRRLAHLVGRSGCALVTPCWDEPFGLVLAEALMTGTPVAAFDRGGISEVLEGLPGTRLVPPGDVAALAAAADELLRLPSTARVGIREHAVERFSAMRRDRQLEALYRDRLDAVERTAALP
ncbi:glycosyltransferase [Agrococcus jenensis]|uniref:Glycosyltransferase involved in cell wall biosynthesis n=1 Tax=Agrococcus jenensis TaxID=46353 RepID=A0A3N2AQV1_9MICO|nr:glycosyltransferase [Agrococcus jenensis]ROR65092.1 glycosyltransferase involved in cell wall biosynthesis [Agrococcus jenensis]